MGLICGYRMNLSGAAFVDCLKKCGFAHATPSDTFCPADNSLIAARRIANMMANPQLAAISLLAKKLATPGTASVFDFRVGPAGNIGETIEAADAAKHLFLRLASRLGLQIEVVLTENRQFPSSALGRLESLCLLWQVLNNEGLLALDTSHVELCIELAARAIVLVDSTAKFSETRLRLNKSLQDGSVKQCFLKHVEAQGGDYAGIEAAISWRNNSEVTAIRLPQSGRWIPPDINKAKAWLKSEQKRANTIVAPGALEPQSQIGLKLSRSPGDVVEEGGKVLELRYPVGIAPYSFPDWLAGNIHGRDDAPLFNLGGAISCAS